MLFNPILAPQPTTYAVTAAPTINVLNSIMGMMAVNSNPGINDWLRETVSTIPDNRRLVYKALIGTFGVNSLMRMVQPLPEQFPDYLDALAQEHPDILQQRILATLEEITAIKVDKDDEDIAIPDIERMLNDRAYYLNYLSQFDAFAHVDQQIFLLAHHLLTHPDELKRELLDLLVWLWEEHVSAEWARIEPTVQASARALQSIPTDNMAPFDAIHAITGRNLRGILREDAVNTFKHIHFIPSTHNGPYVTSLPLDDTLFIVFGARMPDRQAHSGSRLDHAEILNRVKALGDEARLDILIALREHGELSTPQIMALFDLNKSAASRHLRNLRAAELIIERRDDDGKGKFYRLNDESIGGLLNNLRRLLT